MREGERETLTQIIGFLILVVFGVGYLGLNAKYGLGTLTDPGPGIFPLVAGLFVVVLSSWKLFQSLRPSIGGRRNPAEPAKVQEKEETGVAKPSEKRVILMILAIAVYILAASRVGFLTSTFFLILFASRLSGAKDWLRPVLFSLGILLFCYLLFEVWLKLALPRGWLI